MYNKSFDSLKGPVKPVLGIKGETTLYFSYVTCFMMLMLFPLLVPVSEMSGHLFFDLLLPLPDAGLLPLLPFPFLLVLLILTRVSVLKQNRLTTFYRFDGKSAPSPPPPFLSSHTQKQ